MATPKKTSTKKAPVAKSAEPKVRVPDAKKPAAKSKAVVAKAVPKSTKPAVKAALPATAKPAAASVSAKSAVAKVTAKVETSPPPRREAFERKPERMEKKPPREIETIVERPSEPAKPQVDAEWIGQMREMLVNQRHQLVSVVESTQAQIAEKDGDLADVSDRASEGFEDELAVGLMAIEAAKLDDIEAAIQRIDEGSYGLCVDCKKAIPRKRLEVLPFARRCLACEGQSERRSRVADAEDEGEEDFD